MNNNSDIDGNSYNTCQSLFHKRISCKNLFKSRRSTLMNVNIFPDRNGRRGSDNNTNYNRNESIGTIKLSPIRTSNINSIEQTYSKESSQFVSATLMLIILSFYLIACTVPTGIVYLIQFRWLQPDDCLNDEMILKSDEWNTFFQRIATKGLIDALCASHYACNFFIYFLTCTSFRKKALYILKCKFTTLPYQSDYVTETLILSRRTAPRSLRPLSDNNDNKGEQIDNKSLLIYNNSK
ncbi:unnamed protein product [Heterobilharzia americana]|nr:unnamed protein product [Heterobilharzia americana]